MKAKKKQKMDINKKGNEDKREGNVINEREDRKG